MTSGQSAVQPVKLSTKYQNLLLRRSNTLCYGGNLDVVGGLMIASLQCGPSGSSGSNFLD